MASIRSAKFLIIIISFYILAIGSCTQSHYPTKVSPGVLSTNSVEMSCTFSKDGLEVYFARSDQEWGKGGMTSTIFYSTKVHEKWSFPKIVSFSGQYDDGDPHLTSDGRTLYFISDRPDENGTSSPDIWRVVRDEFGNWGEPQRLPEPVNSTFREYSPRTDGKGNLYFASDRPGGLGQGDLYVAYNIDDQFDAPMNMGPTINSQFGEWNLEINSPGDLIIFESSERSENLSSYGDLYISFKSEDTWSNPQNIREINTTGSDLYPFLTPDQETLYFTSSDSLPGTNTDLYKIPFQPILDRYKSQ